MMKEVYFRRTQRGGANLNRGGTKSRVKPIGRWLLRRLIWATGAELQEMKDIVDGLERGAVVDEEEQEDD